MMHVKPLDSYRRVSNGEVQAIYLSLGEGRTVLLQQLLGSSLGRIRRIDCTDY